MYTKKNIIYESILILSKAIGNIPYIKNCLMNAILKC